MDEAFALVSKVILKILAEPANLMKVFMGLLGVALTGLVVSNVTSLVGKYSCV